MKNKNLEQKLLKLEKQVSRLKEDLDYNMEIEAQQKMYFISEKANLSCRLKKIEKEMKKEYLDKKVIFGLHIILSCIVSCIVSCILVCIFGC